MKSRFLVLIVVVSLICGCDPDQFNITISSSEIEKARNGMVGYAKARVSYDFNDDELQSKLPRLKNVVLSYTCNGEVDYDKNDFSTSFNVACRIPIGDAVSVSHIKSPIAFILSGNKLELCETRYLGDLNNALEEVNSQVKAEFSGCRMNVSVVRNTGLSLILEAFGVFVDEKPQAHARIDFDSDDQKTISFPRGIGSVYHDLNPFFNIVSQNGYSTEESAGARITGLISSPYSDHGPDLFVNAAIAVDGDRDGSEAKPYASIQSAVDKAKPHQRIIVADGDYSESVLIENKSILLCSKNGPFATTIHSAKGRSGITILNGADGTEIRGLSITGGTGYKRVNGDGYIMCGGGCYCETGAKLIDCIIYQNGKGVPRETAATRGGAVFCGGGGELLISNCLMFDNFAWAGGGGIHIEQGKAIIEKSTIVDNEATDFHGYIGGIGVSKSGKAEIRYSIVWGNGGDQIGAVLGESSGTEVQLRCSDIEGGPQEGRIMRFDSGCDCFAKFPRFEDPVNSNYELKDNSPCRNVETHDGDVEIGFSRSNIRN